MILSIDVGIRNLAMCMLDETSNLIVHWDVSGVPPEHKDGLFVSLRDHLDDKPWILKADTILIEKQPDKNRKMKMVECCSKIEISQPRLLSYVHFHFMFLSFVFEESLTIQ